MKVCLNDLPYKIKGWVNSWRSNHDDWIAQKYPITPLRNDTNNC